VKSEEGWRVAGGKKSGRQVMIYGKGARTVAEAINAIYRKTGLERREEVKYDKKGVSYLRLTNEDLKLLNIK